MPRELLKILQGLRDQYAQVSLADVVVIVLLILGLLALLDGIENRW